jgi:hypothetical protein
MYQLQPAESKDVTFAINLIMLFQRQADEIDGMR